MPIKQLLLFFLFACFFKVQSATCVSISSGDWANPAIWSCGHVPTCGDSIVILAAHNVSITTQQNYTGCSSTTGYLKITIFGKLRFNTGSKLSLPCNSRIYIFGGGAVEPGTGGGNSNYIEICNDQMWNAAMGPYSGPACMPSTQPGCGTVLPIELTNFSATLNGQSVEILWATASEKNSSHFEIERSADASDFKTLYSIPSKAPGGFSTSSLSYQAMDNDPLGNTSYYRLKQVDTDNTGFYSKIVSVNVVKAKNLRFLVYPNPNNGEFTVDISGLENNHHVMIALRNESGMLVYESSFYLQEISTKMQIVPNSKLPKGIYICTLLLEEIEYSIKVVVS